MCGFDLRRAAPPLVSLKCGVWFVSLRLLTNTSSSPLTSDSADLGIGQVFALLGSFLLQVFAQVAASSYNVSVFAQEAAS